MNGLDGNNDQVCRLGCTRCMVQLQRLKKRGEIAEQWPHLNRCDGGSKLSFLSDSCKQSGLYEHRAIVIGINDSHRQCPSGGSYIMETQNTQRSRAC